MTFFAFLNEEKIAMAQRATGGKILRAQDYTTLVEAEKLLEKMKADEELYKEKAIKRGEKKGFKEGLKQFNEALALLEEEKNKVRQEMENALIPLAMAAVKKIIGKEMDAHNVTIVDIIATQLKTISHHKKVKLYVNKADLELIESERGRLKDLFEHLQSLSISAREDVAEKGCTIETEAGILHVSLDDQLAALEKAFKAFSRDEKTS